MGAEETGFDRVSKKFALAISRRSLLGSLSLAAASYLLSRIKVMGQDPSTKPGVYADSVLRLNPTLKIADAVDSANWTCDYTRKVNIAHSSDGSVAPIVVTVAEAKCIGKNADKGTFASFEIACISPGRDVLPSVKECVDSKFTDASKFVYERAEISKDAKKRGVDKYGRKCNYDTLDKKARIVYRKTENGWNAVCSTPIVCDNFDKGPKHWVVACKTAGIVILPDRRSVDSCPQVVDCIEDELPLSVPHEKSE